MKRNPYLFNGPTVGQSVIASAHPTSEVYPWEPNTNTSQQVHERGSTWDYKTAPVAVTQKNTPTPGGISYLIENSGGGGGAPSGSGGAGGGAGGGTGGLGGGGGGGEGNRGAGFRGGDTY